MNNNFLSHYLITRFNIYSENYFSGDIKKFLAWSEDRVKIFRNFTLPSVVAAHKNSNFKWIILFDEKSPASVLELINYMAIHAPFVIPRFVEHGVGFASGSIKESRACINECNSDAVQYILTTRIDNDDGMHEKYMHFIYHKAMSLVNKVPVAINFERGICYYDNVGHMFNMKVPNMFVSLLENALEPKTVISYPHGKIGDSIQVLNIENNTPLWLMNVHDGNWANTKKNGKILSDLSPFNLYKF